MTAETKGVPPHILPEALLWSTGGHASDVALTTIADGQLAIVPKNVLAHVESCSMCFGHLGNAALLSLHVDRDFAFERERLFASRRLPMPRRSVIVGLAVAALGIAPTVLDPASRVAAQSFFGSLPLLARSAFAVIQRIEASSAGVALAYGAAGVLFMAALVFVRSVSKKEVIR